MKKKVFTKDLEGDEVIIRLKQGQKLYSGCLKNVYYIDHTGYIMQFTDGVPTQLSTTISLTDEAYFVDEVEEPEADTTCIGKLCWFWNDDESEKCRGVLEAISNEGEGLNFFLEGGAWFARCRPLTAEEVKQLVKE